MYKPKQASLILAPNIGAKHMEDNDKSDKLSILH